MVQDDLQPLLFFTQRGNHALSSIDNFFNTENAVDKLETDFATQTSFVFWKI